MIKRSIITLILTACCLSVSFVGVTPISESSSVFAAGSKNNKAGTFTGEYTKQQGVLTFRGNNLRDDPTYGYADVKEGSIDSLWKYKTPVSSSWGGGAGWTGQPVLIKWKKKIRKKMNLYSTYKNKDFVEVIQGSLNGYVYFFDLSTGKQSRPPINTGNPIKGSVSLDARGYPMLYVGQGINERSPFGFILYNLYTGRVMFRVSGADSKAPRKWGAFDGSALFDRIHDRLYVAGENGLFYKVKLNTEIDIKKGNISIRPKVNKHTTAPSNYYGVENSIAAYNGKFYFSDNGGNVKCFGIDMKTLWKYKNNDDSDSTIVMEKERGRLVLYSGTEVDKQGSYGKAGFVKLDADTGKKIWKNNYNCYSVTDLNGGMLSTPALGKKKVSDLIFITLCRIPRKESGKIIALNKKTGKKVWEYGTSGFAWSSPVLIYDKHGKAYLFHIDIHGNVRLFNARTGKVLKTLRFGYNFESSPAVYKNKIVVASRAGYIHCFKLK